MNETNITIRLTKPLKEAIKAYAARKGVTVAQITAEHYRRLIEMENQQEAEQI